MRTLANKEIYHIGIGIQVTGDNEVKTKLTAIEKMTKQTEKKMKALDKVKASPSVRLKDKLSEPLQKIKGNLSRFKESAATEITALIGLGASAKAAMDFEKGMTKANTIAQLSKDKLNALSRETLGLSNDTGVVAKDLAEMEYNALSASVAIGDLTNVVKTSSTLSKGGFADANDSLKLLTSTYNVYREEFDKMGLSQTKASEMIADKMINIQNLGVTTVGELSTQLGNITPIAKNANMTLDELSSGMIVLTKNGLGTSEAVTGMKSALSNIIKPSEEASKMADALGLDFSTTAIKTKGFGGFLTDVRDKLKNANPALVEAADKVSSYQHMIDGASKGQKQNKEQMRDWKEGLKGAKDELKVLTKSGGETTGALAQLFGSVDGLGAVLSLTSEYGMKDFQNGLEASKNSLGSTKKAADMMAETKAEKFEKAMNKLKNMGIDLGLKLFPAIEKGIVFVSGLADKFNSLGPATQGFIINAGLAAVALKPFSGVLGGVAKGLGGLVTKSPKINSFLGGFKGAKLAEETTKAAGGLKALGLAGKLLPALLSPAGIAIATTAVVVGTAFAANASLMKKSVSTTTEELGPMERIMNKLTGSVFKSKAEMQGFGLIYEDFGKNIGSDFKKKVEESTKSIREFQFFINKINLDGKISDAESVEFDSKVNEMCNNAIKTIESKKDETQSALKELFADDGTISEAEQVTLDYFSKNYDEQISAEQKLRDEIYRIKKQAITDHGKLLDEDIAQIKANQEEMARIELQSVGGNEDEINYSKNKFKARAEGIDIKDASELLKDSAKNRDDAIVEIKAKYDTYVDKLKTTLDNDLKLNENDSNKLKPNERAKMETTLSETETARTGKIKTQNDLYDENLNTLYKQNPNLEGKLNKYDGSELTGKDIKSQKALEKMKKTYDGLEKITKNGHYRMYDSTQKRWRDLEAVVDERTGEISGLYNSFTGECGGYTEQLSGKVKELSKSHTDLNMEAGQAINLLGGAYVNAEGQICNSSGSMISNLSEVTTASDGTRTGILNLNGTPIQITSNKDGVITNMGEVTNSINNIPSSKDVNTSTNADETTSKVNEVTNSVNNVPTSKTITFTAIVKKIFKGVKDFLSGSDEVHEEARGTNFSSEGLSTVDERGWELSANKSVPILGSHNGNPLTYMSRGTKILNHMQSVNDMKDEVSRQVNSRISNQPQPQQIQYQVVQPQQQVQVAGMGGLNFGGINVNVDGNQDIDAIIAEATQEVGRRLKEALVNIKK